MASQKNQANKKQKIRRYNSKNDDSNVIISIQQHRFKSLWEFANEQTYYIVGPGEYKKYMDDDNFQCVKLIPQTELSNYVLATYANGETWIVKKEDINPEYLRISSLISNHNGKIESTGTRGNAMIYARTSTKAADSIKAQIGICLDYAEANSFQLYPFGIQFDENISGRDMKNLNHELGYWSPYMEEKSHLIVSNVDRISRNVAKGIAFLEELISRGITIHFVNEELILTPGDHYHHGDRINELFVAAEEYSNTISLKARANKSYHKKRREEKTAANKSKWLESRMGRPMESDSLKKQRTRIPIKQITSRDVLSSDDEDDDETSTTSSVGTKLKRLESAVGEIKSTMSGFTDMMKQFRGFSLASQPMDTSVEPSPAIKKSHIPVRIAPSRFVKPIEHSKPIVQSNPSTRLGFSQVASMDNDGEDLEFVVPSFQRRNRK